MPVQVEHLDLGWRETLLYQAATITSHILLSTVAKQVSDNHPNVNPQFLCRLLVRLWNNIVIVSD